jgi:uncharacterized membrane protein YhaH (DUF805 family)
MIEQHRNSMRSILGLGSRTASFTFEQTELAVIVVIPFDDAPVPPRRLEKKVREIANARAHQLASLNRGETTVQAWEISASESLRSYVELAMTYGSVYHAVRWSKALELASSSNVDVNNAANRSVTNTQSTDVANAHSQLKDDTEKMTQQVVGRQNWVPFTTAIKFGVKRSFNFYGRASRSEFWWMYLLYMLIMTAFVQLLGPMVDPVAGLEYLIGAAVLGPLFLISVTVRRMHDIGLSGWWLLILLPLTPFLIGIPILGALMTLPQPTATSNYLWCRNLNTVANRWGVLE